VIRFPWLRSLRQYPPRISPKGRGFAVRRRVQLSLEALEDRLTPNVYNVGPGDVKTLIADIKAADQAGGNNVINLSPGFYTLTTPNNYWYGPNGLPPIYNNNLTIHGNGAIIARDTTNSATPDFRLFYISGGMELPAGSLTMDNVTLMGGVAKGGDSNGGGGGLGAGGAIFNQGTLNLTDVTLEGNVALGGSNGVAGLGNGGGGMGQDATTFDGGGFGGSSGFNGYGGLGGVGGTGGGGGGGGFVKGADGKSGSGGNGFGGGLGAFTWSGYGDGGPGGANIHDTQGSGGNGGAFGSGGSSGNAFGGGGGIGGGGGAGLDTGGDGGFGGGGGFGNNGGNGGFGGGSSSRGTNGYVGGGGFGGGDGTYAQGSTGGGGGAGLGGAIFNMGADSADAGSGLVALVNCTLTNNTAQGGNGQAGGGSGFGGAIFNVAGNVILTNDTLASNAVIAGTGGIMNGTSDGGAVYNLAYGHDIDTGKPDTTTLVLNNSILATSTGGSDLVSAVYYPSTSKSDTATVTGSHNLVMTSNTSNGGTIAPGVITLTADPKLSPLEHNGGLTPTMLPQSGSPVLGAGNPSLAPSTDQRGDPRPSGGPTDLGSVQVSVAATSGGAASAASPSLFQALLSLFLDGAFLEVWAVENEFATINLDEVNPQANEQAAAAGINLDAAEALGAFLDSIRGFDAGLERTPPVNPESLALADIYFNLPYAGPFGLFAVADGVQAALQAVQLQPSS